VDSHSERSQPNCSSSVTKECLAIGPIVLPVRGTISSARECSEVVSSACSKGATQLHDQRSKVASGASSTHAPKSAARTHGTGLERGCLETSDSRTGIWTTRYRRLKKSFQAISILVPISFTSVTQQFSCERSLHLHTASRTLFTVGMYPQYITL
jgi:hypothetical protein